MNETRLEAHHWTEPESEAERQAAEVAKYDDWLDDTDAWRRLLKAIRNPETIEGWEDGVSEEQDARNSRPAPY